MDQGTQRLIKRHNAQMRDLIVRDIDALEDKLNVKRQVATKVDDAVDTVKGKLGMNSDTTTGSWSTFARGNAVPLAAISFGGAMLAKNLQARASAGTTQNPGYPMASTTVQSSSDGGGIRESVGGKASDAKDAITGKAGAATEMVGEHASHAKDVIVERIPSRDQAVSVVKDHGQLLGMAALAAGALAGTFMPRTQAEEARLAPLQSQVRDKASELVETGKELVQDKVETAQEAVVAGVETAKETFSEDQSESAEDDTTFGSSETSELPDLTQPNRILGSRVEVGEPFSAGPSTS
ncbi:MAG: hypothetical protein JWM86_2501 [Thermoleophilia bacterium]|nr:hypothetical protein [Thermoleophilia bacterium]